MEYFVSLSKEFQSLTNVLGHSPVLFAPGPLPLCFSELGVLEAGAVQRDPLQRQITRAVLAADVPLGVQGHV